MMDENGTWDTVDRWKWKWKAEKVAAMHRFIVAVCT
jgi:hypothetical protein